MKISTAVLAIALFLGTLGTSFAGNKPAVTYPAGMLVSGSSPAQMDEATPWHKGAVHYSAAGVVTLGPQYRYCPVMTNVLLNSKHESEVTLSNGKRIMLSWAGLKDKVEANLQKYQPYMY
jgi:hypothetical protein